MIKYYTYTLTDPINNLVRYVGATRNPEKRFYQHIMQPDGAKAKVEWVAGLIKSGLKPIFEIAGTFDTIQDAANNELFIYNKYPKDQLFCKSPEKHIYKPLPSSDKETLTFYLGSKHIKVLERICKAESRTKAAVIERLIDAAYDRYVLAK